MAAKMYLLRGIMTINTYNQPNYALDSLTVSEASLVATPATDYTFDGWERNRVIVSTNATYEFIVYGTDTYTEIFPPYL